MIGRLLLAGFTGALEKLLARIFPKSAAALESLKIEPAEGAAAFHDLRPQPVDFR
jgi:hypothetical protein